jgi:hypothetical protein
VAFLFLKAASAYSLQPRWLTITIQAASVPTPVKYEAIRPELASFGLELNPLPNTVPKKPHGIALIRVT